MGEVEAILLEPHHIVLKHVERLASNDRQIDFEFKQLRVIFCPSVNEINLVSAANQTKDHIKELICGFNGLGIFSPPLLWLEEFRFKKATFMVVKAHVTKLATARVVSPTQMPSIFVAEVF